MSKPKRWTVFTVEGLVAGMNPDTLYIPYNVAKAYGKPLAETKSLLEEAYRAGLVERVLKKARAMCYKLKVPEKTEVERAPRPYPHIQLTKNLNGYDHANREFAALCMMVRR